MAYDAEILEHEQPNVAEVLEPVMTNALKGLWHFAENLKPYLTHAAEVPWPITIHVIYDGF